MSYTIVISMQARKQFNKLDRFVQAKIAAWIERNLKNAADPFVKGKKLVGPLNEFWRYRIGDYRLLTEVKNDELIIFILKIGHRKDVYK